MTLGGRLGRREGLVPAQPCWNAMAVGTRSQEHGGSALRCWQRCRGNRWDKMGSAAPGPAEGTCVPLRWWLDERSQPPLGTSTAGDSGSRIFSRAGQRVREHLGVEQLMPPNWPVTPLMEGRTAGTGWLEQAAACRADPALALGQDPAVGAARPGAGDSQGRGDGGRADGRMACERRDAGCAGLGQEQKNLFSDGKGNTCPPKQGFPQPVLYWETPQMRHLSRFVGRGQR